MMQFSAKLIMMGAETLINVKPSIVDTTEEAVAKFDPEQRGCYSDGEANMTYLLHSHGKNSNASLIS